MGPAGSQHQALAEQMNTAQSRHAELAEPTELARSRREALAEPTSFSLEQSRPTVCVDAVGYGHWSSQGRDFRPPRDSLWSDSDMSNVLPSPQTPGSSTAMRPPSLVSTPPPAVDIARRAHAGVVGQGRKDIEALRGNFDAVDVVACVVVSKLLELRMASSHSHANVSSNRRQALGNSSHAHAGSRPHRDDVREHCSEVRSARNAPKKNNSAPKNKK